MGKVNNIWSYLARHKYLITCIIGMLMVGVIDENSFRKYILLQMRYNEVQEEYNAYVEQYQRDSVKLSALNANRKGVEHIARERYFMKHPDEDIFILSTDERTIEQHEATKQN